MTNHPDQRFIDGLLQNDKQVVEEIYRNYASSIRAHILRNRGSADDAADIFQEALIDIYNQAKYRSFQLTCPFGAFLLLVCKRKWLNELKKRGHQPVTISPDDLSHPGEDLFSAAEKLAQEEGRARLFLEQFQRLGLSLTGRKQEEIASALGITYGYLRKKKSECMATLLSNIQNVRYADL
jgi:DNA-directed RNA polymerase specialized sigma24 family protein